MLKPLLVIVFAVLIALALLQLRQQRLELTHQAGQLHSGITDRQARLWEQQMRIAVQTSPRALASMVQRHELGLVPVAPTTQPAE